MRTATQYAFSDSNDLASVCQKAADENDAVYPPPTTPLPPTPASWTASAARPEARLRGEEGICAGCGVGDPVHQLLRSGLHHR